MEGDLTTFPSDKKGIFSQKLFDSISGALKFISSMNIIYSDLKLRNVLWKKVNDDFQFKLCDFSYCINKKDLKPNNFPDLSWQLIPPELLFITGKIGHKIKKYLTFDLKVITDMVDFDVIDSWQLGLLILEFLDSNCGNKINETVYDSFILGKNISLVEKNFNISLMKYVLDLIDKNHNLIDDVNFEIDDGLKNSLRDCLCFDPRKRLKISNFENNKTLITQTKQFYKFWSEEEKALNVDLKLMIEDIKILQVAL